jgi:hypothetical protein
LVGGLAAAAAATEEAALQNKTEPVS